MGTPYSKDYTDDQKQIAKLTFQARQFLCCVSIDDEGQATLPYSMLEKYQALVEEAEDYLRNAAVNQASAVAAARADEREKAARVVLDYMEKCEQAGCDLADKEDETSKNMYWRADGAADALEIVAAAIRNPKTGK